MNETLKELMRAHGVDTTSHNEWIVPDGKLPGIRISWYEHPEGKTGKLTVDVLIEENMMIVECFAGIGSGDEGFESAVKNFCTNSFHVFLAAFWNEVDPDLVLVEPWANDSGKFTIFAGNFGTIGANGLHPGIPKETFDIIENAIKKEQLINKWHWVRTYFCNLGECEKTYEALLDNANWQSGLSALKSVPWYESEDFYSVRKFFLLKKNEYT